MFKKISWAIGTSSYENLEWPSDFPNIGPYGASLKHLKDEQNSQQLLFID